MNNMEIVKDMGPAFLTEPEHVLRSNIEVDHLIAENMDDSSYHEAGDKTRGLLREQDRFLPIYKVANIMKQAIPALKISKGARECVQECVSEFISFITSEANERCNAEKRRAINGEDILFAMSMLGFDNYVEPLKVYLEKYREATQTNRSLPTLEMLCVGMSHDDRSKMLCHIPGARANYRNYSNDDLEQALDDIRQKRLTISVASRKYKIAKSTLWNKLHIKHNVQNSLPNVIEFNDEDELCVGDMVSLPSFCFPEEI